MPADRPSRVLGVLTLIVSVACLSCSEPLPPSEDETRTSGPLSYLKRIPLDSQVDARCLLSYGSGSFAISQGDEHVPFVWSRNGNRKKPLLPTGPATGQVMEGLPEIVPVAGDLFAIADRRSYRVTLLERANGEFHSSFVVSPYEVMPTGLAGSGKTSVLYLFAAGDPDGLLLSPDGRYLGSFDAFSGTAINPYSYFSGAVGDDGALVYTAIGQYQLWRVAPNGDMTLFSMSRGDLYESPTPVPEEIKADLTNLEKRYAWEDTVSWVTSVAYAEGIFFVNYTVPEVDNIYLLDAFATSGIVLGLGLTSPGRLLGCEKGSCWFLSSDREAILVYEVSA